MRARPGSPQRTVAVVSLLGLALVGLLSAPIAHGQDESFETAFGPPTCSEGSLADAGGSGMDDPAVNVTTGNTYVQDQDLSYPSAYDPAFPSTLDPTFDLACPCVFNPFAFTRTYNSESTEEGSLGLGWTDSYDYSLTYVAPDGLRLSNGDGNVQFYEPVEAPSIIVVAPVANPPVLADPPDTMPKRVLVVDDEATVWGAFDAALSAKGYHVSLAEDGRQAFWILRQEHFDLIFLDILFPVVGGASVLKAIKRRDPEAVVVLITGFPYHDDTLTALEHVPAMLLPKPITLTDIDAVLKIVSKEPRTS
ncbi:MAG: response regulator [Candidatus Methylomirabilales bacterium]